MIKLRSFLEELDIRLGANLSRADLTGANLLEANLGGANLTVADFTVDEDETVMKGKSTVVVTTFIRLQVRFVDAKTGQIYIGSGEGESQKVGESFLKNLDMKFSQSTVGKATRKSLETATTKVIENLIKNGIFTN